MPPKKKKTSTRYKRIVELNEDIKQLTKEIGIIENIINYSAANRARTEFESDVETSPLWYRWFKLYLFRKKGKDKDWDFGMVEVKNYPYSEANIRMSEVELSMILGFKESERDMIRKELQNLINRVNDMEDEE